MTPKEKAEELIGKCYDIFINDEDEYYTGTAWRLSKQCALIAVDEILSTIVSTSTNYGASWTYWTQVKQEIKRL